MSAALGGEGDVSDSVMSGPVWPEPAVRGSTAATSSETGGSAGV